MRIIKNKISVKIGVEEVRQFIIYGEGSRRTISISNTKKITARRKNRVEKGSRALFFGSNPHSKGLLFSRSFILRALNV